jgi:chromosome segregation protein
VLGAADLAHSRARDEVRFQERLATQAHRTAVAAETVGRRLTDELREKRKQLEAEQRRAEAVRAEAASTRGTHEAARRALALVQERLSTAAGACRDDEQVAARLRDQSTAAKALVDEQRDRVTSLEADLARHADMERAAASQIARLRESAEAAATVEDRARIALQRLESELLPLEERLRDEDGRYTAHRATHHAATQRLAEAQAACDAAHRDLESAVREQEVLRAQVSAELRCELEDLPDGPVPYGAVARVRALRAELTAAGPLNARAEEDYSSASERLTFLQTQSADLRDGVARLRSIIEDANATVRERFASTVEQLDTHFSQYFERLFDGGSCRLVAEYDARGLPSGVEVRAQPPGKRTRDLALLSGGERALVAMALLFAMLRVRPVPFCLLDEVEAALDEANTGRFGAILREISQTTQFLVVTHNRGTMLHADRLYGVTMSDAGISTIASLELSGTAG